MVAKEQEINMAANHRICAKTIAVLVIVTVKVLFSLCLSLPEYKTEWAHTAADPGVFDITECRGSDPLCRGPDYKCGLAARGYCVSKSAADC